MRDDWFGHRNPLTGEPYGDKDQKTSWDYALMAAFQTIEDYTDEYGLAVWEREDEYAVVDAVRKIHPFVRSRDVRTGAKNYKAAPGEYYIPDIKSRRAGGELQTYSEWINSEIEKNKKPD